MYCLVVLIVDQIEKYAVTQIVKTALLLSNVNKKEMEDLVYIVFNNRTSIIEFETTDLFQAEIWIYEKEDSEDYLILNDYHEAA